MAAKSWEYKCYGLMDASEDDLHEREELFNLAGGDGWEMVTTYTSNQGLTVFWFKREV